MKNNGIYIYFRWKGRFIATHSRSTSIAKPKAKLEDCSQRLFGLIEMMEGIIFPIHKSLE